MTRVWFDGSVKSHKDATWGVLALFPDGLEIERRGKLREWKIHAVEARALEEAKKLLAELGVEGPVTVYGDDQSLMRRQRSDERIKYVWIRSKENEAHAVASG